MKIFFCDKQGFFFLLIFKIKIFFFFVYLVYDFKILLFVVFEEINKIQRANKIFEWLTELTKISNSPLTLQ